MLFFGSSVARGAGVVSMGAGLLEWGAIVTHGSGGAKKFIVMPFCRSAFACLPKNVDGNFCLSSTR